MQVRYIKHSLYDSNHGGGSHFVEVEAFDKNNVNIALNKPVTANFTPTNGELSRITDGVTSNNWVGSNNMALGKHEVVIDLGDIYDIRVVKIYHFVYGERKYKDNIVKVSCDNIDYIEIFNSNIDGEYVESFDGKTIELKLKCLDSDASIKDAVSKVGECYEEWNGYKNTLRTTLTSKNVEVSEDDKMSSLIDKIPSIVTTINASENIIFSPYIKYQATVVNKPFTFLEFYATFNGSIRIFVCPSYSYSRATIYHLREGVEVNKKIINGEGMAVQSFDLSNILCGDYIKMDYHTTTISSGTVTVIERVKIGGDILNGV